MKLVDSFLNTFIYLYEFMEYLDEIDLGISPVDEMPAISGRSQASLSDMSSKSNMSNSRDVGLVQDVETQDQSAGSNIDVESIRANFKELLSTAWIKADESGYSPKVIERAAYAVIALIDEKIMSSKWGQMNRWFRRTLQSEYFSDANAGVKVFTMIEELKENGAMQYDIVEVFYYCLSCGLVGSYFNNPAKLREIRADLLQYLKQSNGSLDTPAIADDNPEAENEVMQSHVMIKAKNIMSWFSYHFPFIVVVILAGYFYIAVDTVLSSSIK